MIYLKQNLTDKILKFKTSKPNLEKMLLQLFVSMQNVKPQKFSQKSKTVDVNELKPTLKELKISIFNLNFTECFDRLKVKRLNILNSYLFYIYES